MATARSARFSARVPEIGNFGALCSTTTSSRLAASVATWSGVMSSSSATVGVRGLTRLCDAQFFAPSHIAKPISPAIPTMNTVRPSDTGPIPPRP